MSRSIIHRALALSLAVLASLSIGLPTNAGTLATTNRALNDGFGPDAGRWHGTVDIMGAAFGDTLIAQVDWAAFAPGQFQLFLGDNGYAGADPSGPGEVLYVYQITSVTNANPGVDTLTVGVDPTDGRGLVSAPSYLSLGLATEKAPTSGADNTTSMDWFFNGAELQVGDTSGLLMFSSPFAPEYDFLQVNSGLAGPVVSPLVASPSDRSYNVPEPTTAALALACTAALLGTRRVR
jgi:hypothetical protein